MPSDDDDMSRHFDVVVIGAGPAGEAAAELGGTQPWHRLTSCRSHRLSSPARDAHLGITNGQVAIRQPILPLRCPPKEIRTPDLLHAMGNADVH